MYASLRKQNRIFHPVTGKTFLITPVRAGRDKPSTTDEGEQEALVRAMKHGEPVFLLQHANGSVYDVVTNRESAIKERDSLIARTPNGINNIKLYERRGSSMVRL